MTKAEAPCRRTLAAVLLAGSLVGCGEPTASGPLVASFSIAPSFAPGTLANAVNVDNVRLRLFRSPTERASDTIVVFPADSSRISVLLRVPLRARSEKLTLLVELRFGVQALYSATELVTLFAESQGPTPTPHVILSYVGPGAAARTVRIEPRDTILTFGDSFTFRVSATDGGGAPVNDLLVLWSTLPPLGISTTGVMLAPGVRGIVKLRALTPAGFGDSTSVRFAPPPALLALVNGAGQAGQAGSVLPAPFGVQVRGADGLGVPGVVVRFRALTGGGAVRDATVVSDATGFASTLLTLGSVLGINTFEAAVTGVPVVVVNANATP